MSTGKTCKHRRAALLFPSFSIYESHGVGARRASSAHGGRRASGQCEDPRPLSVMILSLVFLGVWSAATVYLAFMRLSIMVSYQTKDRATVYTDCACCEWQPRAHPSRCPGRTNNRSNAARPTQYGS